MVILLFVTSFSHAKAVDYSHTNKGTANTIKALETMYLKYSSFQKKAELFEYEEFYLEYLYSFRYSALLVKFIKDEDFPGLDQMYSMLIKEHISGRITEQVLMSLLNIPVRLVIVEKRISSTKKFERVSKSLAQWLKRYPSSIAALSVNAHFNMKLGRHYRGTTNFSSIPLKSRKLLAHFWKKARTQAEKIISLNNKLNIAYYFLLNSSGSTSEVKRAVLILSKNSCCRRSYAVHKIRVRQLSPFYSERKSMSKLLAFTKSKLLDIEQNPKNYYLIGESSYRYYFLIRNISREISKLKENEKNTKKRQRIEEQLNEYRVYELRLLDLMAKAYVGRAKELVIRGYLKHNKKRSLDQYYQRMLRLFEGGLTFVDSRKFRNPGAVTRFKSIYKKVINNQKVEHKRYK